MSPGLSVLVVDGSVYARMAYAGRLTAHPAVRAVETAATGEQAIERLRMHQPDVVLLDVHMRRMDGVQVLERILSEFPAPVVLLANSTENDARDIITGLEQGAVDYQLKPPSDEQWGQDDNLQRLVDKLAVAATVPINRPGGRPYLVPSHHPLKVPPCADRPGRVVVIGASVGGPRSLMSLMPDLSPDPSTGYLLVQHMDDFLSAPMAAHLDQQGPVTVREARRGDRLAGAGALLAPGRQHLVVASTGEVDFAEEPSHQRPRPLIDLTMETAARAFGPAAIGVILSGTGTDGITGAAAIKAAGGTVICEDESTCAVFDT
ncbi:MAG: chemotaxis protein CheB, partial [Dehalococcoidia bacterium]